MSNRIKKHTTFFEMYHQGMGNILLHFLGFALFGFAIGSKNTPLVIIAPLIFESGHLYNYLVGNRTKYDKQQIPMQLFTWVLFSSIGFLLIHILHFS